MLHRQDTPRSIRMVAAVMLLLGVVNLSYFLFYLSTVPFFAMAALVKTVLSIAAAIGLLRLSEGWRIFILVTTGLGLPILPFYFLLILLSSDFALAVSGLSGIDSRAGLELAVALGFAVFLWIFRTLARPDVERAFQLRKQPHLAA